MEKHIRTSRVFVLAAVVALCALPAGQAGGQSQSVPPEQNAPAAQRQPSAQGQTAQNQNQPSPSLSHPGGNEPAPTSAPSPPSPEEQQAFQAMQKEPDPAKQIQLVKDFEKQYPNSSLLTYVYYFGAEAARNKQDVPTSLTYCQASLKLQPNNLLSLILISDILPSPQALALQGANDQKQQQLTAAENYGNHALQLLTALQPPPNTPPDQFDLQKKQGEAAVHAGLGMAHLEKALLSPAGTDPGELAAAEQEYKAAVAAPQPTFEDYYRLGEVYTRENKLDDAIGAFNQAAQLSQGEMKDLANQMIEKIKAQQAKAGNNPPAAPPPSHN